ncbi:MAG: hypothetical protein M1829_005191 [Trizodia sp. TS-e1964]|nr:MAG: hypothetical protein M1829_005191 [Trizodia sp. TS-e1964]
MTRPGLPADPWGHRRPSLGEEQQCDATSAYTTNPASHHISQHAPPHQRIPYPPRSEQSNASYADLNWPPCPRHGSSNNGMFSSASHQHQPVHAMQTRPDYLREAFPMQYTHSPMARARAGPSTEPSAMPHGPMPPAEPDWHNHRAPPHHNHFWNASQFPHHNIIQDPAHSHHLFHEQPADWAAMPLGQVGADGASSGHHRRSEGEATFAPSGEWRHPPRMPSHPPGNSQPEIKRSPPPASAPLPNDENRDRRQTLGTGANTRLLGYLPYQTYPTPVAPRNPHQRHLHNHHHHHAEPTPPGQRSNLVQPPYSYPRHFHHPAPMQSHNPHWTEYQASQATLSMAPRPIPLHNANHGDSEEISPGHRRHLDVARPLPIADQRPNRVSGTTTIDSPNSSSHSSPSISQEEVYNFEWESYHQAESALAMPTAPSGDSNLSQAGARYLRHVHMELVHTRARHFSDHSRQARGTERSNTTAAVEGSRLYESAQFHQLQMIRRDQENAHRQLSAVAAAMPNHRRVNSEDEHRHQHTTSYAQYRAMQEEQRFLTNLLANQTESMMERRVTLEALQNFTRITVDQIADEEDRTCSICTVPYGEPLPDTGKEETPLRLPCSHTFGEVCIKTWFARNTTCPICRCQLASEPIPRPRLNSSSSQRRATRAVRSNLSRSSMLSLRSERRGPPVAEPAGVRAPHLPLPRPNSLGLSLEPWEDPREISRATRNAIIQARAGG